MNIFDILNEITTKKTGKLLDKSEHETDFEPYMIQRWLSMRSDSLTMLINGTTNILHNALENKRHWYKLFISIIPKLGYKRIRYIKKVSKSKTYNPDLERAVEFIARSKGISKREVRMYIEEYGLDIDNIKETLKRCQ